MSGRTMSLCCVSRWQRFAAQSVFACRHWLKVCRINAATNPAEVIDLSIGRQFIDENAEGDPVRS